MYDKEHGNKSVSAKARAVLRMILQGVAETRVYLHGLPFVLRFAQFSVFLPFEIARRSNCHMECGCCERKIVVLKR